MARYKVIACHVLWREICYFAARSRNVFDFLFLKQGLHNTPDLLRTGLQAAIDASGDGFDALLIGYGLCSNGLAGITARGTKLVVPRAHDCITFLLGSKERYREYFDAHPGTYWYSPGWIDSSTQPGKERYEQTYDEYVRNYGEENAKYLMEMEQGWFNSYSNAAYVDLAVGDNDHYREYTKECARWLGWKYDELEGSPDLMQRFLAGKWDGSDFLVVEPDRKIEPSFNESVIKDS